MINVYCSLIINKRRTFDNVPEPFKDRVKVRLKELGYDENGEKLAAEV